MPDDHDTRQRELLEAVWNDYDNDAPRLAYADWLDTLDDPAESARAEYIRLDTRRRTQEPYQVLQQVGPRLRELSRKYSTAWLAGFPDGLADYTPLLRRGMFEATVNLTGRELLANGDRWFRKAPPDIAFAVVLRNEPPKKAAKLPPVDWLAVFGKPWWERVIRFEANGTADWLEVCRALAANPAVRRLRSINFHRCRIGDEGAAALAASPHLTTLSHLDLTECNLTGVGVLAIARRETLTSLKTLFAGGNSVADGEWDAVRAVLPPGAKVFERGATIYFDPNDPAFPVNTSGGADDDIPF